MSDIEAIVAALQTRAGSLKSFGYRARLELIDTGESILIDATGGAVIIGVGDGEADTALRLSCADLKKLIAGQLSPMLAFSLGRLKVDGSKGVALKLASLLDEDYA